MEKSLTGAELTSRMDFKIVIATVIAVGIFLRFFHLGFQDYWHDEAITSLHIAGHTKHDAYLFLTKQPRQFGELISYCEPLKNGFATVWTCWTREQPEKAPLFYILEYFWACALGGSVVTMRLLPALLSLLQLPAFFWFGVELFGSRTAAWLMVALVAISPTAVLYAQEAREYSLYTAMIAFVCAAFLRAVKDPSRRNWLQYAFILTVSLYTSFLILFSVIAQFSFLLLRRKYDALRALGLCNAFAAVLFTPWLSVNLSHFLSGYSDLAWVSKPKTFLAWVDGVFCNYWMPIFFSGEVFLPYQQHRQKVMGIAVVLYSFYKVARARSHTGPLFLISLLLVGSAPFIVMDLVVGGFRATVVRYMIHVHVVVISCVAYMLSSYTNWNGSWKKTLLWYCAFIGLCIFTADSTLSNAVTHTSFFKMVAVDQKLRPLAYKLNEGKQPSTLVAAVTGNTNHVQMFALCRIVKPETRLIFVHGLTLESLPMDVDQFYLFNPIPEFVDILKNSGFTMKLVPNSQNYWLVRRPEPHRTSPANQPTHKF